MITKQKKNLQLKINPILKRYKIKKAALFGSYVRGENKKDSDLDLLVEMEKDTGLFDFIGLKLDLEKTLKRKIDLVEYSTIKSALKKPILNSELPIYQI